MKITFLTLDMTVSGGIERVVTNLANCFIDKFDYKINIVSIFKKNDNCFYEVRKGANLIYLNDKKFINIGLLNKITSHIKIIKSLKKYFKQNDSDIVISTFPNISIYMAFFINKKNIKVIAAEHSRYYAHNIFVRSIRKLAYHFIDYIVTLTKNDQNIFSKNFDNVECIPNPTSFYPKEIIKQNKNQIITAGRLVKEKGFDELLRACKIIFQKHPEWKLNIWGDGYLENELINLRDTLKLQNYVQFYPSTKHIQEKLLDSDIYVCSSTTEAFPMIFLEAMSCALPIVSFNCPVGPKEIISNEVDGILVENRSVAEMADKICNLIEDKVLRNKLGDNARKSVSRFMPEVVAGMWDTLFKKLLK